MTGYVSEKVIEDILSSDKSILADLLCVDASDLSMIARQKNLDSGRLDFLYLYQNQLLLIELKTVSFYADIIRQVNGYFEDLKKLQMDHKLIGAEIKKIVLATHFDPRHIHDCNEHSILPIAYKPEYVLSMYYENFKEISAFLTIQSADYGMIRLGLLRSTLKLLALGKNLKEISQIEKRSEETVRNRLSVAILLGLVSSFKEGFFLTDFGETFLQVDDTKIADNRLSDGQSKLLSDLVMGNPFFSSITYSISAIVETVFVLAKSTYPVSIEMVQDHFVTSIGKKQTWKTKKARETATYIFSNYACDLDLLTRVDKRFYLTPVGIQAILLLQLNRSIKLIESRK